MATVKQSKARQKPYQGKAQPGGRSGVATPKASSPAIAKGVATANKRQKNFAGGTPSVTKAPMAGRKQKTGAANSHAQVARSLRGRDNYKGFRDLMIASGEPVGPKHVGPNRSIASYPADMIGGTSTSNKGTKKTSVKTPTAKGPKIQTTARAYKASFHPKVMRAARQAQ